MADDAPLNVERLPTLTEVLELGRELPAAPWRAEVLPALPALPAFPGLSAVALGQPAVFSLADARAAEQPPQPRLDEAALVERVLAALQPRIDSLLEARVSEALAPALARAAELLIRDSREELMHALRDLAQESLAQALRKGDQPDV